MLGEKENGIHVELTREGYLHEQGYEIMFASVTSLLPITLSLTVSGGQLWLGEGVELGRVNDEARGITVVAQLQAKFAVRALQLPDGGA